MDDRGNSTVGGDSRRGESRPEPVPVVVATADRLVSANERAAELLDADSPRSLVGSDPIAYVHPEDRERVRARIRRVLEAGEDVRKLECRVNTEGGEVRHVEASMGPCTVDGDPAVRTYLTDVTAYRRTERRLRVERRFLRRIIDAMAAAVFVFDEHGELVFVNDAAVERTGYAEGTLNDRGLEVVVPEPQRERIPDIWAGRSGGTADWTDIDVLTAEGERIPHEFTGVTVEGGDDDDRYMVAVGRDVSDRKRRERKLRRQNERLREFAQVVSHDLRNPLEVARARLELLDSPDNDDVEAIENALDRMNDLIEDVLELAQEGQVVDDLEAVSLAATARESWEAVSTGGADLVVEDDCWIRADRGRLRSLLENLYDNSVEHGTAGDAGDLTVRVGPLTDDGDLAGFYVEDDGTGIDVEDRERIFESGFSTAEDGTGFGLVIVDQIARAHNWSITVATAADGDRTAGTRFEFTGVDPVDR